MSAVNYYLGLQRGGIMDPESVTAGTSSAGTAVDLEVRIQINNGTTATNITRKDCVELLDVILAFINGGGSAGGGANLPAM